MREFINKHPYITFLIADGLFTCVQNCCLFLSGRDDKAKPTHAKRVETMLKEVK